MHLQGQAVWYGGCGTYLLPGRVLGVRNDTVTVQNEDTGEVGTELPDQLLSPLPPSLPPPQAQTLPTRDVRPRYEDGATGTEDMIQLRCVKSSHSMSSL